MKTVVAEFRVDHARAYVSPPGGEQWGALGLPEDPETARFVFEDKLGIIELRTPGPRTPACTESVPFCSQNTHDFVSLVSRHDQPHQLFR